MNALVDHLLTRDYHLASAAKKSELVAREATDEVAGNSRISNMKAGHSKAEMPSAILGGAGGHMAGSAVGSVAGEYESEGGVAGAIIGALAGLASPKAAAKIVAKMMSKKANRLDLTKLSGQEKSLAIEAVLNTLKAKTPAKAQKMSLEEAKAKINALGFNADNLEAHIIKNHSEKDAKNRLNKLYLVADTIKNFDIKSIQGADNAYVKFWVDDNKDVFAYVVTKQKDNYIASYLPLDDIDKLKNRLLKTEIFESPSNTENSILGTVSNAKSQAHNANSTPNEIKSQGQVPKGWMKGATNIASTNEKPKWGEKLKAKMAKMGQEYSDEKIANLANWHKNSHAVTKEKDGSPKVFYHGTNAKFDAFDIDKGKGSWLGKSFYFTDSKSKAKGYGKNVMPLYLNIKNPYIAKANDHYGFVNEVKEKFGVKENYGEFDPTVVLKEKGYDGVVYKDWDSDVGTIYTAFSPNQIKSIDNSGAFNPRSKMMRGFSTQALNEVMLGLGSGTANAMAEDDPNKKAEAFIKGFLAGFGGAKAASMLAKNAPKLAPQLARVSQKMAQEFPTLMDNRPDILGGVLGKINNAKDNFKNIFGGEKALGANKAKLEEAQTMLKSGKNEGEIWANTGWYKDIDNKWKFEINPKGGELKEAKSDLFSQDDIKKWQKEYIEKKLSLNELSELNDKYKGQIDITPIARAYDESENISIKELSEKYPNLKMSVADYMDMGVYKEFYTQNKIITARKVANGEVDFNNKLVKEVLDDKELFKAYAELEDLPILTTNTKKDGVKAYFMRTNSKGIEDDAIFFDYEYLQTASKEDIKSTLYHELQHAVQKIEGFASGADSKAAGLENYFKSAGEAEARNEQIRLGSSAKEREYIVNNPQRKELIAQIKEVTAKNSNLDQIMSDYKAGKITAEQKNELIKQNSENIQKATAQLVAKREMLDKKLAEEYLAKTHPYETMDIAPDERIVSYDGGVSASYTPKQKEMRGVYNVAFNEKRATQIYKDIEDIENAIKFEKGRADNISANKDGFGSLHIQKHLDPKNEGYITTQEYLNMGEYIRKAGDFKESGGKRVYDYTNENGVRFRAIIGDTRGGKDRVISFFSDRKAGSAYDRQNYTRNQPLSGNSSANEIKSQELAIRESFSPELKASYDMRDKLLKSTSEVRASLSDKGKAELEKLANSNDSKLRRDAQIMKTLENAKSDPARYEKLKKIYLDENGNVKDSIGLC